MTRCQPAGIAGWPIRDQTISDNCVVVVVTAKVSIAIFRRRCASIVFLVFNTTEPTTLFRLLPCHLLAILPFTGYSRLHSANVHACRYDFWVRSIWFIWNDQFHDSKPVCPEQLAPNGYFLSFLVSLSLSVCFRLTANNKKLFFFLLCCYCFRIKLQSYKANTLLGNSNNILNSWGLSFIEHLLIPYLRIKLALPIRGVKQRSRRWETKK